ncbi:MAG TPA: hypothetical protein VI248_15150 [Kineosporiaceae bacterium]
MGRAGRAWVLPRSWDVLGEALVGHYRSVLPASDVQAAPAGPTARSAQQLLDH